MTRSWQLITKHTQALHEGGTKFYRCVLIEAVTSDDERHEIVAFTNWGKAGTGWEKDSSAGQRMFSKLDKPTAPPGWKGIWLNGQIAKKRKGGYMLESLESGSDTRKGFETPTNELRARWPAEVVEHAKIELGHIEGLLAGRGYVFGEASATQAAAAAASVNLAAVSLESEGWGTW